MKKLLSVLLSVLMAVTFAVGMTACDETPAEHTHEYATAWSNDETDHWHACTVKSCTEVKDRAAHTWDDGEITTPATETADGIKTFTCTVCGKTKTESVEYVPVTTVTADQWDAIFADINNPEKTGGNMTATISMKLSGATEFTIMTTVQYDWAHKTFFMNSQTDNSSVYAVYENGKAYKYTQSGSDTWIKEEWYTPTDANAFFVSLYDGVWLAGFIGKFTEFTYDAETETYSGPFYTIKNGVATIIDGMSTIVSIADGKLLSLVGVKEEGSQKLQFSDYGTTTVTLPTIA